MHSYKLLLTAKVLKMFIETLKWIACGSNLTVYRRLVFVWIVSN